MAYELKVNQGSLFVNNRKQLDTHPDMTGEINVGGCVYWVSGWSKLAKDGKKWLSLSVRPKQQTNNNSSHGSQYERNNIIDDNDLPF